MWNFLRKNFFNLFSFLTVLGGAGCFIADGIRNKDADVKSPLFWVGFALVCLSLICYFINQYLKKRSEDFEARKCYEELQKETTKYVVVSVDFPTVKKINPKKRLFTLTLYRETDEALLLKNYQFLLESDEEMQTVDNAYISEFKATLSELTNIRSKTLVLYCENAEQIKMNPLYADLTNHNRIITYDYED